MGEKRPPLAATDKRRQAGHKHPAGTSAGGGRAQAPKEKPKKVRVGDARSANQRQKQQGRAKPLAHLFHDRRVAEKEYRTKNRNASGRRAF